MNAAVKERSFVVHFEFFTGGPVAKAEPWPSPELAMATNLSDREPSRKIRLSKFDTQGVHVTWKDEEEAKEAEGTLNQIEEAFSSIIGSLGDGDPERDGLKKTPKRAAKALLYFTKGYEEDLQSQ